MIELTGAGLLLLVTLYLGGLAVLFGPLGGGIPDMDGRRRALHRVLGLALRVATIASIVLLVGEWLAMGAQLESLAQGDRNVDSEPGIVVLDAMTRIVLIGVIWLLVTIPLLAAWLRTRLDAGDERADSPGSLPTG